MVYLSSYKSDHGAKFYSVISYIGPLFIIVRFLNKKQDIDIEFHSWHGGMLFFTVSFLYMFVSWTQNFLFLLPTIAEMMGIILNTGVWTFWVVLSIMGIVNAYRMERKSLPFISLIDFNLRKHYTNM